MQVDAFLADYQPNLNGAYRVTWFHEVDGFVHRTLAGLAGLLPGCAWFIHVQDVVLQVDQSAVTALWDPDGEVQVSVQYRINQIPNTFKARMTLFAADIETLEPVNDLKSSPLPC